MGIFINLSQISSLNYQENYIKKIGLMVECPFSCTLLQDLKKISGYLKEAWKKFTALTGERLPQEDPLPQIWLKRQKKVSILKWCFR